eukprot:5919402-Prymnesium_polylepis.1
MLARLIHSSLSSGFSSWRLTIADRKAALHLVYDASTHIFLHALMRAVAQLRESARQQRVQSRALRRMKHSELSRGWRSWQIARRESMRRRD